MMEEPKFNPKFIPLINKNPDTTRSYTPWIYGKCAKSSFRSEQVKLDIFRLLDSYIDKCDQYFGEDCGSNYNQYTAEKNVWELYASYEKFGGTDPDPVYTRVFEEYFAKQKKLRKEMNDRGDEKQVQIKLLTELQEKYNEQLVIIRGLNIDALKIAAGNKEKKSGSSEEMKNDDTKSEETKSGDMKVEKTKNDDTKTRSTDLEDKDKEIPETKGPEQKTDKHKVKVPVQNTGSAHSGIKVLEKSVYDMESGFKLVEKSDYTDEESVEEKVVLDHAVKKSGAEKRDAEWVLL